MFSAVLTAFNVESYKSLKADSTDTSAAALTQISHQITRLASTGLLPNSSVPAFTTPAFTAPRSAVRINALWFCSLVLGLVSASLGMLVKQWLREYLTGSYTSPRERIRVRHHRYEGLLRWRVFEIAAMPALLLQLSLILFFVGLSDFLRQLDPVVGWFVTGLIVLWLLLFATSTLAPVFFHRCPYKFPLLRSFAIVARHTVLRLLRGRAPRNMLPSYYEYNGNVELGVRQDASFDVPAVTRADATSNDDDFLEATLCMCLRSAGGSDVVAFMRKMLAHRLGQPVPTLTAALSGLPRLTTKALFTSLHIAVDALEPALRKYQPAPAPWIDDALEYVFAALDHSYTHRRAIGHAMDRGLHVQALLMSRGAHFVRACLTLMSVYRNVPSYFYQLSRDRMSSILQGIVHR